MIPVLTKIVESRVLLSKSVKHGIVRMVRRKMSRCIVGSDQFISGLITRGLGKFVSWIIRLKIMLKALEELINDVD